jgi:hypothetical protein
VTTTTLSSVLKAKPRLINAETNTEVSGAAVFNRIPVAALMHAVQTLPEENADSIATLLADEHRWPPEVKAEAVRRIRDLQFARLSTVMAVRSTLPAARTPAAVDQFLRTLDDTCAQAQDQLYLHARCLR